MPNKLHLIQGLSVPAFQISCILFRFLVMDTVDLDTGELILRRRLYGVYRLRGRYATSVICLTLLELIGYPSIVCS
jgi:hypothetical protein